MAVNDRQVVKDVLAGRRALDEVNDLTTNDLTVNGAFTSVGIDDNASAEVLGLANANITWGVVSAGSLTHKHVDDDTVHIFSGGNSANVGGNAWFYGGSHATVAGDWRLRSDTDIVLQYDNSADELIAGALLVLSDGQIEFPASQNASSNANTLDDYEEGTWTPTVTFDTAGDLSVAYTNQNGYYRKVGSLVYVSFNILTSSFTHTTASGSVRVAGLPFTTANITNLTNAFTGRWSGINESSGVRHDVVGLSGANVSYMFLVASGDNVTTDFLNTGDVPTGSSIVWAMSGSYIAAN